MGSKQPTQTAGQVIPVVIVWFALNHSLLPFAEQRDNKFSRVTKRLHKRLNSRLRRGKRERTSRKNVCRKEAVEHYKEKKKNLKASYHGKVNIDVSLIRELGKPSSKTTVNEKRVSKYGKRPGVERNFIQKERKK